VHNWSKLARSTGATFTIVTGAMVSSYRAESGEGVPRTAGAGQSFGVGAAISRLFSLEKQGILDHAADFQRATSAAAAHKLCAQLDSELTTREPRIFGSLKIR